jgi:ABC-2 type transport system permease protein
MKGLWVSIWAESLKVKKSAMFVGTILFFAFIGIMMGLLMFLARHPEIAGRTEIMAAKASMFGSGDWSSLMDVLIQIALTVSTLGFGLATAWVFGREYADKVIKDIIALPVSRTTIVFSKLVVVFAWCLVLTLVIFVSGSITGIFSGMPGWSAEVFLKGFSMFVACSMLNILLCPWVAFISSMGRGYLLSIAYLILTLIVTQLIFVGAPALATYTPWAFPALFSGIAGSAAPEVSFAAIAIYAAWAISGIVFTVAWWNYADQKQ